MVHKDSANFGLNYASSFVFPLQGFWNVIVYIVTSQTACKNLWASIRGHGSGISSSGMGPRRGFKLGSPRQDSFGKLGRGKGGKDFEEEGDAVMLGKIRSGRQRLGSDESGVGRV